MPDQLREVKHELLFPMQIRTNRLLLRPPEFDDAPVIFAGFGNDPAVTRYLTWHPSRTVAETESFLRTAIDAWNVGVRYPWVVSLQTGGQIVGMIEARFSRHMVEIGYVLGRDHWGHGYAAEALVEIIRLGLDRPEIFRVWACCDTDNTASARVMEKAGMQREGILRRYSFHPNISTEPRDVLVYAAVR